MDDNKVSVITLDIIHVTNIDIRLEIVENYLSNIHQMPHDVGRQLDERTSTSFQINSLNSRTKTIFHMMVTAHVSVTYIELRSAV